MKPHRPFGVTLLAILGSLAGIVAAYHTLQYLHILPFSLGGLSFYGFDLWGALLWGILAVIYAWVVSMLWTVNPQGWLFVVILSSLNLILAVLSIIGQSTLSAVAPAIVVNGVILLYALLPGTRRAFGSPELART
jgi:hypothetical protein